MGLVGSLTRVKVCAPAESGTNGARSAARARARAGSDGMAIPPWMRTARSTRLQGSASTPVTASGLVPNRAREGRRGRDRGRTGFGTHGDFRGLSCVRAAMLVAHERARDAARMEPVPVADVWPDLRRLDGLFPAVRQLHLLHPGVERDFPNPLP